MIHGSAGELSTSIFQHNCADAQRMISSLLPLEPKVLEAAKLLIDSLRGGHKLLACGNGGSAADASHMTTEFVVKYDRDRRPYPAISFATNGGDLTACANDGFADDVFSRQVRAFAQPGDIFFAFSTSGNSENVFRALTTAKDLGIASVALLGKGGGRCKGIATVDLLVPHTVTARVQEGHKLLLHTICELFEAELNPPLERDGRQ